MHKIIDNFLPQKEFEEIKNFILDPNFSWNLCPYVTKRKEHLPITASYYFTHHFWMKLYVEPTVKIFSPILDKLECKAIIRIKANLYPSTEVIIRHENHIDSNFFQKGAIFYLNTNNGFTVLEDEIEIKSVENRLLLFDPSKPHYSTTCSDDQCRINVIFNYF